MKGWRMLALCVWLSALLTGAGQAQAAGTTVSVGVTFVGAELVENNHVGNEWETKLTVNGKPLAEGDTVKLKLKSTDNVKLVAKAEEMDKYPDIGTAETKVQVSAIGKAKTKKLTVVVTENRGRYSGSTATWSFEVELTK